MPIKRKLKDLIGGVSDQLYGSNTSLLKISDAQRRREAATRQAEPLNRSTYDGRRRSDTRGNSDYVGPMNGAGEGTRDRMPGTTPSNSYNLTKPDPTVKPKAKSKKGKKSGVVV